MAPPSLLFRFIMDLGNAIRLVRKGTGLDQKTVASSIGISPTYLSQIEKNKKEPSLKILQKISDALSVPLPVIFFLSLTEEDVPSNRKQAFKFIYPAINEFVKSFFNDTIPNDKQYR